MNSTSPDRSTDPCAPALLSWAKNHTHTGIPVCVWFFAQDKSAGAQGSVDRSGEVLFIDGRELGYKIGRASCRERVEIAELAATERRKELEESREQMRAR